MDIDHKAIGERLQALRLGRDINQEQSALDLHISRSKETKLLLKYCF